ncbi:hypothetical protein ABI59_08385 [Acidobacteria bacterium Mor1]|nr:hypothetical protein ABI59_08385 [Acidobacteria bacterium Mor1]
MIDLPEQDWQRTSPTAILLNIGRFLKGILTQGLQALLPLVAVFATVEKLRWTWLLLALIPLGLILLVWAFLGYLRFQYKVSRGQLLVRQGVIQHERLTIDFKRVQNISIQEPFYMRPLGLAVLGVDTAGSASKEVKLGGIRRERADALRTAMLAEAAAASPAVPSDVPAEGSAADGGPGDSAVKAVSPPSPELLIQRTPGQIARYGLTSSGLVWVALILGAIFSVGDDIWFPLFEDLIQRIVRGVRDGGLFGRLALLAGVSGGLLVLPLLSMAGALFRYYGYRLERSGETYRRSAGLLNRHEVALKRHKIQALVRRENAVARLLGIANLKLEVTGSGSQQVDSSGMPVPQTSFIVPALEPAEADAMTREFVDAGAGPAAYSRPDRRRFISRVLLFGWTPPILLLTLPPTIFAHWLFAAAVPLLYGLAYGLTRLRWSRWGYGVDGEFGYVRVGFIGRRVRVFPLFKVQQVGFRQTPGQRRAGLTHLNIRLASGSMTVPHVPEEQARRWADLALYHAETNQRAWY